MTTQTDLTAYRWTPIRDEHLPALTQLVNHLARVDGTEEFYGEDDLREELHAHGRDAGRDTVGVWEGEELIAWTGVGVPLTLDHEGRARGYVEGGVREDRRGRGIGWALMDRAEARAVELLAERHPGVPAYLRSGGGLDGASVRDLLTQRGYAVVRWFNLLTRPSSTGRVEDLPPLPEGVRLVSPGVEHRDPTHRTHTQAFRDHWGSGPSTAESWAERWRAGTGRLPVSSLAVRDGEGGVPEVLAYVLCGEWVEGELYVNLVGTAPEARGQGLAAACLARTIDLAAESGYRVVELEVDSESPTGATRLYDRLGFTVKHRTASMQKDLAEPPGTIA